MNNNIPAEYILSELIRRQEAASLVPLIDSLALPGIQVDILNFVKGTEKDRAAILATRSAGKTYGLLLAAILVMSKGGSVAYVSKSYSSVRDICWDEVKKLIDMLNEKLPPGQKIQPNYHEQRLEVRIGKGKLKFYGADNQKSREGLRGPRFELIIVDEAGHFATDLNVLIDDILTGCTFGRQGKILLSGTPSYVAMGLFHEITVAGAGFSGGYEVIHETNPFCNPYTAEDVKRRIVKEKERHGEEWKTLPFIQREIFAQWVVDISKLVYKFTYEKNALQSPPEPSPIDRHTLGLDFSFSGTTGIVHTVFNPFEGLLIREAIAMENIGLDQIDKLGPTLKRFNHAYPGIIIAYDSAQEFVARKIRATFPELNMVQAQKHDKYYQIEMFNADLTSGNIKVLVDKCEPLIWEWERGTWKTNTDTSPRPGKPVPNDRCRWDCADAAQYAWKYNNIRELAKTRPPVLSEEERLRQEERKIRRSIVRRCRVGRYFI